MNISRRETLGVFGAAGAAGAMGGSASALAQPAAGPFTADWASLAKGYRAPDWFRDAKFGMWAHWSAQCVPEEGDWYAREMYRQGTRANKAHVAKYGHPTKFGFMEITNLWKAEKWQPERLITLYQRAGAKYFVALANHHDNFDTYTSTHHPWNSTRIGPRKDIIGIWSKLARERGLRFGVSNHSAHTWHWFQTAYGYDPEGPMRGQRYDAARLTAADGKGQWWNGLDPRTLYAKPVMPLPDSVTTIVEANEIHQRTDRLWSEAIPAQNPEFARNWALRCRELIDKYQPDLLYFDNFDLPFQQIGLEIAAHYYNANRAWHNGNLEAVLNIKMVPPERRMGLVEDVERGGKSYIETYPWQTDTCIGDWHYDRALYERDGYKTAATIIHTLCDVVSKNGNLLLNVPMRGDGSIDEKEERIVEEIAAWMGHFGEAIYGTRPWRIHAEGPTKPNSGMFAEGGPKSPYTARDVRYVRKGENVHGLVMGWPDDGIVRLTLWSRNNPVGRGEVERVTVPGSNAPLPFKRTDAALEVTVPQGLRNTIGIPLILSGRGLTDGSLADV
ncbi:alpha-L-fucosidase [Sphingomonas hengshuiensis]|uniref:alpha-L-fucosidase n=1 Tax=Sphingomonas hengshuiensis TaxID=1609977 RepID=A0A7U5BF93_9SPHN|nr:alpha-L-fucosidase [Sphingomonas hengshuiensis]AJP74184.1 alpha-L-fucosidase [Sphingomonas hengshuiensis]